MHYSTIQNLNPVALSPVEMTIGSCPSLIGSCPSLLIAQKRKSNLRIRGFCWLKKSWKTVILTPVPCICFILHNDKQMHNWIIHNSKLQPTRCNVSWFIYFYRRFTCFRRFLRPSSGAHNCTYSFRYCQPILLLAATVVAATVFQAVPPPIIRST